MTNFLEPKTEAIEKADGNFDRIFPGLKEEKMVAVTCSSCGGKGQLPEHDTVGRVILCRKCSTEKAARLAAERQRPIITARLGGLRAYEDFTLARFDNAAAIHNLADYPNKNFYLWGASGTGKTHLATAVVRQWEEAWVVTPQQIYRDCRGLKGREDEQKNIDAFVNAPYLVIDDLGVEKRTDFSFSILYEVIRGRWMEKKNGLIITSNLSLGGLAEKIDDDRITSRINDLCEVIEMTGQDRRGKK